MKEKFQPNSKRLSDEQVKKLIELKIEDIDRAIAITEKDLKQLLKADKDIG